MTFPSRVLRSLFRPTEAQWEYACRAGTTTRFFFGNDPDLLSDFAWSGRNSRGTTHPVGMKKPNAWALYDMEGNVLEWCADWYGATYYSESPKDDPSGLRSGTGRASRGATCVSVANSWFWSAARSQHSPKFVHPFGGFRVVMAVTAASIPKANSGSELPAQIVSLAKDVRPPSPESEHAETREGGLAVSPDRWVELLRRPNVLTGRAMGDWKEDKAGLIASSPKGDMILPLPITVSGNYDLAVEYARINGSGSVHIFLPVGTRGCVLVTDGWGVAQSYRPG